MRLGIIFTYAKLVVLLLGRIVEKMFRMGTIQLAAVTQHVLALPRVNLPNGDQQLLSTESVDNAVQKEATEWVSTSDEDQWEIRGQRSTRRKGQTKPRHIVLKQ
ncbi:unnamed protein product [Peronospora destructor]|uniref:Secreted protein n=1 Tax=Peronospora destructor TaxID=86335 RepID=A0AAV0VBK9_9STRA|nr:unnamed protein product [Peronospora destructor]